MTRNRSSLLVVRVEKSRWAEEWPVCTKQLKETGESDKPEEVKNKNKNKIPGK